MNFQAQEQFYQMVTRLKANSSAGSTLKDDVLVTEIVDGLIVSKPAKKINIFQNHKRLVNRQDPT